jgi:hypothetical protein
VTGQETLVPRKRGPRPKGATGLNVRVPPDLMLAVDQFIKEEAPEASRPEALRRLATEALIGKGMLKP